MNLSFKTTLLALTTLGLSSCAIERKAPREYMDDYMVILATANHKKLVENELAGEDARAKNASVRRLDKNDSTKHNYMELLGAATKIRDTRPVYLVDRQWTLGVKTRNVPVRGEDGKRRIMAPVMFWDQADDGKEASNFDMRLTQIEKNTAVNDFSPVVYNQSQQKDRFELNKDGTVTEHLVISDVDNIYLDVIFDFNKEEISAEVPGLRETRHKVSSFKDANPVTKEIYGFAKDFAQNQKTAALK